MGHFDPVVENGKRLMMQVRPGMTAEYLAGQIERYGFRGFKPYRVHSVTGDAVEISSVCDSDAMDVLLSIGGPERVMHGSDNAVVDMTRGKYITFGRAWSELNERNSRELNLAHCDGRFTFVLYESLRAFRRACRRQGYGAEEIRKLFFGNAAGLIKRVRDSAFC